MWRILRYTPEGWADDSRGGAVGVTRGLLYMNKTNFP